MPCSSDCPCQDSWSLLAAEQGWVSCGNPAAYLVMPGVAAAVWMAKVEAVAKTQKLWQEEGRVSMGQHVPRSLRCLQLCQRSPAKSVGRGIAFILNHG